jgi:hypothetical protein
MANLVASGNYPYVQFQPAETSGVQHTDQEFTDSSGNSYLFRMYNAWFDFTAGNWQTLTGGSSEAYATVQNPDGSIHYYWNGGSSFWTEWQGSNNNTIYNGVDFGATGGGSASSNTAALSSLFAAMATATAPALGGGMARIPQYNFPVNASTLGIPVLGPSGNFGGIVIQGTGGGGQNGSMKEAFTFSINDGADLVAGIFWSINNSNHTSGGTWIKNIAFQWTSPDYPADTCLNVNVWNFAAEGCTFTDCPVAINLQGLSAKVTGCTVDYGLSATQTAVTQFLVQGQQTEISGPSELDGHNIGGNETCISIGGGTSNANHCTFRNLHIYDWTYGIDYSDVNLLMSTHSGTQNTVIDGCHLEIANTAINMVPYDSTGMIFNQTLSNCLITKGQDSTNPAPIVYIDSNGGSISNVGPVLMVNNVIYSDVTGGMGQGGQGGHMGQAQPNQYGVQIGDAQAVSIIGGQISQVGTKTAVGSDGTANIYISGDTNSVIIDGVNLQGDNYGANGGGSTGTTGSAASEYGVLISGDPSYVQISNCLMINLTGFAISITGDPAKVLVDNCIMISGAAVSVTGSPAVVNITNCPGYNDQNTTINTIAHITTGTAYSAATQGSHSGTSYYGPSFVMFTANALGGSFQVNGGATQTLLPTQVVTLTLASPYDTIQFNTHVPAAIQWIGK